MSVIAEETGILPVVFGGDAGAYTLGLECYEAFGTKSLCVAAAPVELITRSNIFEHWPIVAKASDEQRLEVLRQIAERYPDRDLLLLSNSDGTVGFFARQREQIPSRYRIPFPTESTIKLLGDKVSFARVCEEQGVSTPKTLVADLSLDEGDFDLDISSLKFPVVAKPASGAPYEKVSFPGKKKIYFLESEEELDGLWKALRKAGFKDSFLVQEMIPGGDEQMRSLTFYVDSHGRVTLKSAAQVLLQDPSPILIGNPVAMITESNPQMWEQAEKLLAVGNYTGFANFDIKVDPRDGTAYFLEVNPRIGRNCYYVIAAGANPMSVMAADLFAGEEVSPVIADAPALYTLVPVSLVKREVKDQDLLKRVNTLVKQHRVVNPLESFVETDRRRRAVAFLQKYNYYRKFWRHRADLR